MLKIVLLICMEQLLAVSYCSMQIVHLLPTSAVMGGGGKCCVSLKKLAQEGEKESKTRKVWQDDSE